MMRFGFLLLLCTLHTGTSLIDHYDEQANGPFAIKVRKHFGLARGGVVRIDYEVEPYSVADTYDYYFLFLIINDNQYHGWYRHDIKDGTKNAQHVRNICNYPSYLRHEIPRGALHGKVNFTSPTSDQYYVLLAQCIATVPTNPVRISGRVVMTNPSVYEDKNGYLPIQKAMFVRLSMGELVAYCTMLICVLGQIVAYKRPAIKDIHYVFIVYLLIAAGDLLVEYIDLAEEQNVGSAPYALQMAQALMSHVHITAFLVTLTLLSMGWLNMRDISRDAQHRTVFIVLLIYAVCGLVNLPCVPSDDNTSPFCRAMSIQLYTWHAFILLGVILSVNFTVSQLKAAVAGTIWSATAPALQYYVLRNCFLIYLVTPTFLLIIDVFLLSWEEQWVVRMVRVLIMLILKFLVGAAFTPREDALLTRAFQNNLANPTAAPQQQTGS